MNNNKIIEHLYGYYTKETNGKDFRKKIDLDDDLLDFDGINHSQIFIINYNIMKQYPV